MKQIVVFLVLLFSVQVAWTQSVDLNKVEQALNKAKAEDARKTQQKNAARKANAAHKAAIDSARRKQEAEAEALRLKEEKEANERQEAAANAQKQAAADLAMAQQRIKDNDDCLIECRRTVRDCIRENSNKHCGSPFAAGFGGQAAIDDFRSCLDDSEKAIDQCSVDNGDCKEDCSR